MFFKEKKKNKFFGYIIFSVGEHKCLKFKKDIEFCLNIENNNICFKEDCYKKVKDFDGYLTYKPTYCPKCGHVNESYDDMLENNCVIRL